MGFDFTCGAEGAGGTPVALNAFARSNTDIARSSEAGGEGEGEEDRR